MTIIVDWFGPYENLYKVAPGRSLVAMTGKEPYKRKASFYHLGICPNASVAMSKFPMVKRERRYWYCEVAHAPVLLPNVLELVESIMARTGLAQPLPPEPLTFVMRYFKADRTPRAARPGLIGGRMPSVLQWDGRRWWSWKGLFSPPA